MQPFRRKGLLGSEEVWAEMLSSMLGLPEKKGIYNNRDMLPALLEPTFDTKAFWFFCSSNSRQCCAVFHKHWILC